VSVNLVIVDVPANLVIVDALVVQPTAAVNVMEHAAINAHAVVAIATVIQIAHAKNAQQNKHGIQKMASI
jgi:hypothetical protein